MTNTKMIKIAGILLTLVMLVTMLGAFSLTASAEAAVDLTVTIDADASVTLQDTDSDGYYDIGTADELYAFAAAVNGGNTAINGELTANIVVNEGTMTANTTGARVWTPIGNSSNKYTGTFDGAGFSVSGLYFNDSTGNNVGLFGYIYDNGQVKAVTLTNSSITGRNSVGGIAGINYGIITGCVNNAVVSGDYSSVGGIAGVNYGTVEMCGNTGKITTATSEAGGIVGRNNGTIRNCYNTGDVYAEIIDAGGIVGLNSGGTAEYCWSTGNATAGDDYEGGIAGDNRGTVQYCYATRYPIGNNSYGTSNNVGTRTAAQFESGEVAYKLGSAWGQTLGTNATPVFATDANKVYQYKTGLCSAIEYKYTNVETPDSLTHDAGDTAAERFDSATGACSACGEFMAAASLTTADATPVVTYYMTLEEAITAAESAEGAAITLLDDCASSINNWFTITSGSFKINFNGKKLMPKENSGTSLSVEGGNIALFDDNEAQGGASGKVAVLAAALTIDGGIFEGVVQVAHENGTLIIHNGTIPKIEHVKGALTIKGGELSLLLVSKSSGKTPADVLPNDYYFYDKNGKIINVGAIEPGLYHYRVEVFTVKKGADLSTDAEITVNSTVYNGDWQTPNGSHVTVGGVVLEHNVDYYISTYPDDDFINAGTYTITIYGKGNYTGSVEKTFTITKARPTSSDFASGLPIDPVYTGETVEIDVTAGDGIVGMGAITVKYYDANGSEVESAINAGTYTVKIDVAEGDNYEAVTDLEIGCFTIGKATPVVTAPTAIEDLIYKGEAQALVNAGSTTGGTLKYGVIKGEYNSNTIYGPLLGEAIPTATDAGSYIIFYMVESNDNYEKVGLQHITVTIGKATPTLNVTAPVSSVLPGNTILLSHTLTGVKGEVLTNLVTIESAKVGNLDCAIDGFKVTVPSTAVIGGEDKLVVTLRAHGDDNYDDSDVFTLTLDIGMADFTGEIAELEADIDELNKLIAEGGDIDQINDKITAITNRVKALEDNGATDAELADLEDKLTDAYKQAVEQVSKALEEAIQELKAADAADAKALEDAIAALEQAIGDAKQAAVDADAVLKKELNDKVEIADAALEAKVAEVQANLNKAIEELKAADTSNSDALAKAIETLNKAIDAAKAAAVTGDSALEGKITQAQQALETKIAEVQGKLDQTKEDLENAIESGDKALSDQINALSAALDAAKAAATAGDAALEGKISSAQSALQGAIGTVQSNLNAAKTELSAAIASGDRALSDKIDALNAALADAQSVLGKADADNKAELVTKIETADATLDAAIKAVESNLDAAKVELNEAIASGDKALSDKIDALDAALADAQAVLGKADADNKAELVAKIETADATLDAAIKAVESNLETAKVELNEAIASGDKALSDKIDALNAALADAQAVLGKADADNKAELVTKIETADATLDAAIKAVEGNLDAARVELNQAIENGDAALNDKIAALNEALTQAQAALKATAQADKSELTGKIDQGYTALEAAVKVVQTNLDATKTELQEAIDALKAEQQSLAEQLAEAEAEAEQSEKKTTTTQIVSVAAVVAVNAGLLAGAFFFLRRKKLF